jgi:chitinase/chitodextrinase
MPRLFHITIVCLFLFSLVFATAVQAAPSAQISEWQSNTSYAVGAQVTYAGQTYQCLQAHTSLTGWEPPNVPALWSLLAGPVATNTSSPATPTRTAIPPTAITPTQTFTATPGSGVCPSPLWNRSAVYTANNTVSWNSHEWRAKWWTQGEEPGTTGQWGVWEDKGACNGVNPTNTPAVPSATPVIPTGTPITPTRTPGSPTITPTSNPGTLPKHVITGYWQNFNNGARVLKLRDVPSAYNLVAIAFADASGSPGAVSFTLDSGLISALGSYPESEFISDIALLHSQGRKVIISVGGQNGTVSISDATSAANFANSLYSLMTHYGFDGVDIDLENGINPTYMSSALRQLSSRAGSGLIITMAPQTIDMQSTGSGYFQVALNIKDILTLVNMQYYNSGSMLGCDGKVYSQGSVDFITALACIQLQNGLRPDQVGLGLPASTSGAGSGYVSPTIVNNALSCLASGTSCGSFKPSTTYPGIRGAMTWSINWDASNNYQWVNTIAGYINNVP